MEMDTEWECALAWGEEEEQSQLLCHKQQQQHQQHKEGAYQGKSSGPKGLVVACWKKNNIPCCFQSFFSPLQQSTVTLEAKGAVKDDGGKQSYSREVAEDKTTMMLANTTDNNDNHDDEMDSKDRENNKEEKEVEDVHSQIPRKKSTQKKQDPKKAMEGSSQK
jgi:hypothetical protein